MGTTLLGELRARGVVKVVALHLLPVVIAEGINARVDKMRAVH